MKHFNLFSFIILLVCCSGSDNSSDNTTTIQDEFFSLLSLLETFKFSEKYFYIYQTILIPLKLIQLSLPFMAMEGKTIAGLISYRSL